MPIINRQSSNIEFEGATVEIVVLPAVNIVQDLQSKSTPVPEKRITALIDTGASCSCINDEVVKDLNLTSNDEAEVHTPNGTTKQYLFDVCFVIPSLEPTIVIPLQVLGSNLENQPYQALLGRDVLKKCILIYNGKDNSYTLAK